MNQIASDFIDTEIPFSARIHKCRNVVCHVIFDSRDDRADS